MSDLSDDERLQAVSTDSVVSEDEPSNRSLIALLKPCLNSDRTMFGMVVAVACFWLIVLGRLAILRQNRFATFDFDTGIYNQYLWQIAHGRTANTVRGVSFFGHHAQFGFFLLAPLVWLGAGPNLWSVLNAAALAACAPILYVIARDSFGRPWIGAAVGLMWLAQPSVQWWVWEGFHPEIMAVPFLFATWLFGQRIVALRLDHLVVPRKLWWTFAACFLGAIMWKEDLALALVGMGIVWIVKRQWRFGATVALVAALWFAIFGAWMVPSVAGGTVYSGIYGDLGATPSEMVVNSIKDPSLLADRWRDNDAVAYSSRLHESVGYVSVLSPVTWVIGASQWFANISSAAGFTWDAHFRYQAIPTVAIMISFIEAAWWLMRKRRWLGEAAVIIGLSAALWTSWAHGAGPWSPSNYRAGYWPLTANASQRFNEAAIRRVGPNDGVAADYLLVPHLTHRETIYTFPNPWKNSNYGVTNEARGNPAKVQWVIMDTSLLGEGDRGLYASLTSSGEFVLVSRQGTIEVLHRVKPPGQGTSGIVTN